MSNTFQRLLLVGIASVLVACQSTRTAQKPDGPHFQVMTYNVNWGGGRPDLAAGVIARSGADVVCLQETTPEWEQYLGMHLRQQYPFSSFKSSPSRMGGGLGILSKIPLDEVAYVPSETGWFDGWVTKFATEIGTVQIVNVHLRPPISDSGSAISGYLFTRSDRREELKRFFAARSPNLPTLVLGDFNDGENSAAVRWLEDQGLRNALPEFDRYTPTWKWRTSVITLKRRMDHIFYPADLECLSAEVIPEGASDHFPVTAVFSRANPLKAIQHD